jgi:hypothetical protein
MQACSDESAFEWIRGGRETPCARGEEWKGYFVSNLLPKRFVAYAKVFHRIDANYEYMDNPLTPGEEKIVQIPPCAELRSLIINLRTQRRGTRLRWKEIADLLKVPFQAELNHEWYRAKLEPGCWPRYLYGPADGTLDSEGCSATVSILRPLTGNQNCFFRFSEIPFIAANKQLLFQGALKELKALLDDVSYQFTPEYWWPADRSWCLCSDYDLMFTIIGGSKDLISSFLNDSVLECVEVTSCTRIDSYAPMK